MGAVEKLKTGTFKHVESELYDYWNTVKEIKRLKAEILHATPYFEKTGGGKGNLPSDPTGTTATLMVSHRRIEQQERIAEVIREVYEQLPPDKQKLVRLKYWTKPQTLTWEGIANQIPVNRATAIRWRNEIVYVIAERIGWR
jgi:RinA family phage transcriptional activator